MTSRLRLIFVLFSAGTDELFNLENSSRPKGYSLALFEKTDDHLQRIAFGCANNGVFFAEATAWLILEQLVLKINRTLTHDQWGRRGRRLK